MMKVRIKKGNPWLNFLIALVWLGLGVFQVLVNDVLRWSDYGYLIIGFLYLMIFFYQMIRKYMKAKTSGSYLIET